MQAPEQRTADSDTTKPVSIDRNETSPCRDTENTMPGISRSLYCYSDCHRIKCVDVRDGNVLIKFKFRQDAAATTAHTMPSLLAPLHPFGRTNVSNYLISEISSSPTKTEANDESHTMYQFWALSSSRARICMSRHRHKLNRRK